MAKHSNTVEYNIKTNLDSSGIARLQTELSKLESQFQVMRNQGLVGKAQTKEAIANIELIRNSLNKAFNGKLGMLNTKAFISNLTAGGKSISSIAQSFSAMGAQGTAAFTRMYGQISRIDTGLRQVSSTSDKIMNTLGNTVRWGLIASAFASVMNAAHQSVEYVKDLDRSLTNIMMVSGETRDNMNEFARQANQVAQRLGGTTVQMTEATKVFIQQGYSLDKSSQLGEYAVHLANVSEQDSATASDEITAYMNAFKIPLDDLGNAISKWAAVANNTAVDVEELSIASQKAASVAATVGVDLDQFAGHIAAIESVTREAPENIGNGLKTIYSRIADISLGETLEDGVNLGSFAKALEKVGVNVLDQTGKLRDAGIILEDLMDVWQELDNTQRAAVAKTVAGRFQLARFEALMNRADIYENAANISRNETGTATYDRMQETFRDSLEGRTNALQAAIEEIFLNAFETDDFYSLVDATTLLVKAFGDLIEAIGGGKEAFVALGAFLTKSFSAQIGRGISNFITNRQTSQLAESNKAAVAAQSRMAMHGLSTGNAYTDQFVQTSAMVNQHATMFNPEQIRLVNEELAKYEEQIIAVSAVEKELETMSKGVGAALAQLGMSADVAETGAIELAQSLKGTEGDLEKAKSLLENSGFLKLADQAHNAQTSLVQFRDSLIGISANADAEWGKIQGGAKKLQIELMKLKREMKASGADTSQLSRAINQLSLMVDGNVKDMTQFEAILRKSGDDINSFREGIIKTFEGCEKLDGSLEELILQFWGLKAGVDATDQKLKGMAAGFNIQFMATQVTNLASAFMSLSFVMMSVRSLIDIFNNEDMDPFEKFEQILMNVSMIAVMGVPMIGQFRTAVSALGNGLFAYAQKQILATAALEADNAVKVQNLTLTEQEILAESMAAARRQGAALTAYQQAAAEGSLTNAKIAEIVATNGLTLADIGAIAASEGLGVAVRMLWAAFLESPLAPIAAAMLAVTAAIAGIVYIVQQAEANYRRFDTALEEANEKLKIASTQVKEATTKVNDLNNALQDLGDEDPFKGLTEGTQEWNQALIEANEKVLDLLDKYPDLAKYITRGEHGELTFSKEGLETYYKESQRTLAEAQGEAARARINQSIAQNNQSAVNVLRTSKYAGFRNQFTTTETLNDGTLYSNYNEDAAVAKFQEAALYVADHIGDETVDLEKYLADMGITGEEAIQQMARLGDALNSNTLATQSATEAYAKAAMSTNKGYQELSSQGKTYIDNQLTAALGENNLTYGSENEYVRAAVTQFDQNMNWDDQSLQNWYAQQHGYTYDKKENRFYDSSNNEVKGLNYDDLYNELREAYIAQAIVDQFQENATEIAQPVEDALKNAAKAGGDELANIFNGKGGFNESGLSAYFAKNGNTLDLTGLTGEDLQALGFTSAQQLQDAMQTYINEHPLNLNLGTPYDFDTEEEITKYLENNTDIDRSVLDTATSLKIDKYEAEGNRYDEQARSVAQYDKALEELTEGTEEYNEVLKQKEEIEKDSQYNAKAYEKAMQRLSAAEARATKTLKAMSEHFEDNAKILKDENQVATVQYAEALTQTKEDLAGLLDVDPSSFTNDFAASARVLDLLNTTLNGTEEEAKAAYQELQQLAAQSEIDNIEINADIIDPSTGEPFNVDAVRETLTAMIDDLNSQNLGFAVDADIDTSAWYQRVNELLESGAITEQQLTSILSKAGYKGEVKYKEIPAPSGGTKRWHLSMPQIQVGDETFGPIDADMTLEDTGTGEMVKVPYLEGITAGDGIIGGGAPIGGSGGKSGGGGGGGGGGGSKAKSVKKSADIDKSKPAAAENDIYEKVNATLEKLKDSYSKLNKVKDRTWGKGYRDDAQKGLDLLVKEQKTLDRRIEIAKKYADALKTGKSNLAYGIDMTDKESLESLGLKDSDLDGVIDNYISKFEEVRQAARKLDAEAEDYRNKANAEALAYWQSKGGRLDADGNTITEATMSEDENEYYTDLIEKQKNHYDKLVEKANEQWELAEKINDVTKDYEDTMNQIRDDEEEQLDLAHEIEDIQIDLYQRSLDMLDTMHDINDIAAQMKGFFTKLATDDPFRALTESAQAFENSFKDATYNATAYYNDIIEKLQKEQAQVKANGGEWEKYNEAIEFYNQQKANAITNADGLGSGELAQQSRRLTELERWIQNPNAVDNPYGTNTQALYDAYQEQYQKVTDAALEAEERMESVHESIIEAYDKMAEQQDELVQQYDRIDEQLNRTADRVSLYRGEDAYADQATISKQRAKVALEAGKSSLKALDKYRQQLAKAQEQQELERPQKVAAAEAEVARLQMALNADKNNLDLQQQLATAKTVLEQAKYDDSEEIKWLKNQIDETTDYINDKADEAAEHFKDAYENSIDEIAAQTTDKIFGNRDLDLITNDWDWDRDYFGSYKDNVERTLETEKLRLKYLDLLDSAQGSSLGIQRQIKDAMDEQLALLENQKTMSEYDVKLANARLEILQKQIALENAQQNKNQMKLRRDSQGNYKYVYAADQDDIRGKQRELLESEFDAYEMSKDANGDAYQQGIALYQQYIEQRTAIEKKYANDVDTMEKELAKLRENYLRAAEANAEDLQNTYDGMIISVQWMAEHGTEAVQQMTKDVLDALEEKTQESLEAVGIPWNEALANGISDLENLQQTVDETAQAGIDAANDFVDAINGEGDSVVNLVNDANESMQQSFEDTVVAINDAEDATNELATATANLNEVMGAELGAIDGAKRKIQEYEEQLFAAKESTSALAGQLTATQKSLAEKSKEAEQWKTTYENYKRSVQEEKEAAIRKAEEEKKKAEAAKRGGAAGNASTSDIAWGIAQNIWTYGSWGNDPDRHSRISERYGEEVANLTQRYINEYWASGQLVNYDSKKWGYASGGYTGTWGKDSGLDGNNGKLAFLHQKELVLNQQDTENILEAVQVMRSIMDITKMASLGSSGFDARRISQTAADTIEQRVEITAEFPAANSADDIRQALLGLSDAAMQYAYRER